MRKKKMARKGQKEIMISSKEINRRDQRLFRTMLQWAESWDDIETAMYSIGGLVLGDREGVSSYPLASPTGGNDLGYIVYEVILDEDGTFEEVPLYKRTFSPHMMRELYKKYGSPKEREDNTLYGDSHRMWSLLAERGGKL